MEYCSEGCYVYLSEGEVAYRDQQGRGRHRYYLGLSQQQEARRVARLSWG